MPITIPQVLDLLLVLVLVMFIPIGLWRGALREWVALAGIAFGYLIADEWAGPWGGDLATRSGLDPKVASFAVAAAFFLGTTLIVGYGGGTTLPYRPDLTWVNRLLGAAIGLGNGLLILSGTLRIMDRNLFGSASGSPLRAADLAAFLIDSIGWADLGLLLVLLLGVLVGVVRHWAGATPLFEEYAPIPEAEPWDEGMESWSAPASTSPAVDLAAPSRAFAEQETAVLHTIAPATEPASNGSAARAAMAVRQRPVPHEVEATVDQPVPAGAGLGSDADDTIAGPLDAPTPVCPVCGTTISARSHFCSTCGHLIAVPERRAVTRRH